MNIENLTIREAREISRMFGSQAGKSHSLELGKSYLIRSVTHYYVGRLDAITDSDFVLGDSSWIPDTGRYGETLKNGVFEEVEPIGTVIVSRGAIVDCVEWGHDLPCEAKP